MRFSYVALSPEYQKLTGVISAEDETDARKQLHGMGLSVISISETNKEPTTEVHQGGASINTYYFKVIDKKGKEMDGTIDSDSRKTAYRRLVGEYHFEVLLLCESSLPPEVREQKGKEGLEDLALEVEEEYGIVPKRDQKSGDEEEDVKGEEFMRKKAELLEEVANVGKKAESIMEKYAEKLSGDDVNEIRHNLNNLMRIRLSNNLIHIRDLVTKLFDNVDKIIKKYSLDEETGGLTQDDEYAGPEKVDHSTGAYRDALDASDIMSSIKIMSRRMTGFLRGEKYRVAQRRKKGVMSSFEDAKRQARSSENHTLKFISKSFKYLKKAAFSKSKLERRESLEQVKKIWDDFKKARAQNVVAKEEAASIENLNTDFTITPTESTSLFFQEARLFTGWLLSFYTIYFFVAFYTKFKWGVDSPIYPFIEKSLKTPFLFAFTGVLFFIFLAFSLKVNYTKNNKVKSIAVFVSTFFIMILFLLNL